jgi:glutamine phosphoribosylpyrophosphate amidotransferase
MCGLFGFVGEGLVDPERLRDCALRALRRGPHSIGAWVDGWRRIGVGDEIAATLSVIVEQTARRSAKCVVGHCRLAPDESWRKKRNAPPFRFAFGTVGHNGNLPDYKGIAKGYGLRLTSQVDSEILGRLVEAGHARDVTQAFALVDPGAPVALLSYDNGKFLAFRRKHPLGVERRPEGFYFASDPSFGVPIAPEAWRLFKFENC